jgi:hypothetical protein
MRGQTNEFAWLNPFMCVSDANFKPADGAPSIMIGLPTPGVREKTLGDADGDE